MKKLTILLLICLSSLFTYTQTAGPNSPTSWGSTVTAANDWTDGPNIYTSDDTEAYAVADFVASTEYITGYSYGFAIPAGSTIDGIEVVIRKRYDPTAGSGNTKDLGVYVVKAGSLVGTNHKNNTNWTGTFTDYTYGNSTDLWGTTWTATDINDGNFGCAIAAQKAGGPPGDWRYANIDYISITVYYTAPLPIELAYFNTTLRDNQIVDLSWITHSELNADRFEIEKSTDSLNWEMIGFEDATGNSNLTILYTYSDDNVGEGTTYYRLKMIDMDGTYEYSKLQSVYIEPVAPTFEFIVYPNPSDGMNVSVKSVYSYLVNNEITVVVSDIQGKMYYSTVIVTETNGNFYKVIDLNNTIPTGVYVVLGSSNDDIYSQMLIIE